MGKIVSMVKIAHKADGIARLNSIFTDIDMRGRGYTKMLLSTLGESLRSEGFTPLIYEDRLSSDIISAYKQIGYKKVGEITQFAYHN